MHPLQITFPQHFFHLNPVTGVGIRRKQIGQSPYRRGGSLNNSISVIISNTSFTCLLMLDLCFFLQTALQYFTILHLLHMLLAPSLPQLAHISDTFKLLPVISCTNLVQRYHYYSRYHLFWCALFFAHTMCPF